VSEGRASWRLTSFIAPGNGLKPEQKHRLRLLLCAGSVLDAAASATRSGMMSEITALIGALKGLWWPVAAVIIAAVYKVEIRSLLPRLRRAGPTGVEFDPAGQQQAAVTAANNPAPGQLREFRGMMRTPAIERVERQLHANLAAMATPDDEKRDLLIRVLAQASRPFACRPCSA
jgi:hypothetical protein